jgi:hypothetical protein
LTALTAQLALKKKVHLNSEAYSQGIHFFTFPQQAPQHESASVTMIGKPCMDVIE